MHGWVPVGDPESGPCRGCGDAPLPIYVTFALPCIHCGEALTEHHLKFGPKRHCCPYPRKTTFETGTAVGRGPQKAVLSAWERLLEDDPV